jgi:hypothetical protein
MPGKNNATKPVVRHIREQGNLQRDMGKRLQPQKVIRWMVRWKTQVMW